MRIIRPKKAWPPADKTASCVDSPVYGTVKRSARSFWNTGIIGAVVVLMVVSCSCVR